MNKMLDDGRWSVIENFIVTAINNATCLLHLDLHNLSGKEEDIQSVSPVLIGSLIKKKTSTLRYFDISNNPSWFEENPALTYKQVLAVIS